MKPAISYKNIIYIAIILGLLVILWWQSCGGNHGIDPQVAKWREQSTQDSIRLANKIKSIEDSLKDIQGEKELADSMLSDAAKDLKKMFVQNEKLKAEHDKEPAPIPISDSEDIVTDKYVKNCDQCFASLIRMEDTVKAAKRIVDKLGEIHQRQLELKDSEIKVYKNVTAFNKSKYDDLLDKYAKLGKGKASVSMGIEYNYSPSVSEVGAYLLFRTRKGSEVGAGIGGNTMSSWYFSIRAGQKIF